MRIVHAFRNVCRANPAKLAVRAGSNEMTYAELDLASDEIASKIIDRLGIGSEPVAAMMGPNLQLPVCILGIVKAGKIAVVLRGATEERTDTKFQLRATGARLLLQLERPEKVVFVNMANEKPSIGSDDRAAWMDFSSGTTGSAKCVVHGHVETCSMALADAKAYGIKPDETLGCYREGVPLHRSLFDGLLNGFTVKMRSRDDNRTVEDWIIDERITHLTVTATGFRYLAGTHRIFPDLKLISVGGEMVHWGDFKLFRDGYFSDECVFQCRYSVSEAHVVSCLTLTQNSPVGLGRLPVGYPMPGVEIHIVDDEIVIHSPWLAIEYWQNEKLTREKFQVDDNAQRWYRTGDRGYFEDGILHHEGRL